MKKLERKVCCVVLCCFIGIFFVSCVSQPRWGDYVGLEKSDALSDLKRKKTQNTVKLVINWVTLGYFTYFIASIVDSIRAGTYSNDFKSIESRIAATPEGTKVGGDMASGGQTAVQPRTSESTAAKSQTQGTTVGISGAINKAIDTLIYELPKNSTIAVLSVSARDREHRENATLVMDELEFQLVDSRQFRMVDRKSLDTIRAEQNFQVSGDVSDASAVSIGNMLGAAIVITGAITKSGNTQHLTLKALDVKTAEIVIMAREQF